MKSVLISIQPKWVEKICNEIGKRADGTPVYEKEIEVRKTRPKQEVPFRCFIYCTKAKEDKYILERLEDGVFTRLDGKVIGEFICDRIEDYSKWEYNYPALLRHIDLLAGTKHDFQFIDNYLKGQKKGYGWHISNLKIYDKPKELSEFYNDCKKPECDDCPYLHFENTPNSYEGWCECDEKIPITRPPQSWCYVEEL